MHGGTALDGNAAAGGLTALFAFDVTTAEVTCAGCGTATPIAELRLYGTPAALVLRCTECSAVNLRLLRTDRTANLDLSGALCIAVPLAGRETGRLGTGPAPGRGDRR